MSFSEIADYNPADIEQYVVSNMEFFKRWTLNNITLNQLNSILMEQQVMPAAALTTAATFRVGPSIPEETDKTNETDSAGLTAADTSSQVNYIMTTNSLSGP